jgi:hypothetical protein
MRNQKYATKIYKSDSNGVWAHELLLNPFFKLRCDEVFFVSQFGCQYVTFYLKIKTCCCCSCSTFVDIVVSGFITCRTVLCSLTCLYVAFMVQNLLFVAVILHFKNVEWDLN